MAKPTQDKKLSARVLADVPGLGLKAGQVVEAAADLIRTLAEAGQVDPHKDAVAAVQGAEVVSL